MYFSAANLGKSYEWRAPLNRGAIAEQNNRVCAKRCHTCLFHQDIVTFDPYRFINSCIPDQVRPPPEMAEQSFITAASSAQGGSSGQMPVLSTYQPRPHYMQPWGPQMMYPGSGPNVMDHNSQMQYMFHGYQHPPLQTHQGVLTSAHRPPSMQDNGAVPMDHVRGSGVTGNDQQHRNFVPPLRNSHVPSQFSSAFARHDGLGGSSGSDYPFNRNIPTAGNRDSLTDVGIQSSTGAYSTSTLGPWPIWRGSSILSPFEFPGAATNPQTPSRDDPCTAVEQAPWKSASNLYGNEVVPYVESKKTQQRRVQRQRKNALTAKSQQWPIKIECTPDGKLPKDVRAFVHGHFRATSRRFLKLSVIHFRDHPDSDIKVVTEDLDRRFVFNPPLKSGYMLWFIENSMRTSRYLWRKHFVKTGKGEKHRFCPARFFPALVKYWKTADAEEESKRMKEARSAAKKKKELRVTNKEGDAENHDDAWDPLIDEDDDNLIWDVSDITDDSFLSGDLTTSPDNINEEYNVATNTMPSSTEKESSVQVGTNTTPPSNEMDPSLQEGNQNKGTPSYATANGVQSRRPDVVVRSVGRELLAVKTLMDSMSTWRDGVDRNMADVKTKLDLLIGALLPRRRVMCQPEASGSEQPDSAPANETCLNDLSHDEREERRQIRLTVAEDGASSASGVSDKLYMANTEFPPPNDLLESVRPGHTADLPDGATNNGATREHGTRDSYNTLSTPAVNSGITVITSERGLQAAFGLPPNDRTFVGVKLHTLEGELDVAVKEPQSKKSRVVVAEKAPRAGQASGKGAPSAAHMSEQRDRPRRNRKKPSKYIDHVPPAENKPRSEMCEPLKPTKAVWVLHPEHQNRTIALGRSGPHWRSYKKKPAVPNVQGVSWEYGMQQITIEHVYPEWAQTKVLYLDLQRDGIHTISDALRGDFSEDATILWQTRYLNYVEVSKVN